MSDARESVLSPTVVAAIDDLELSARLVVEGMRTGGNRSPFHGYSTEFRQHRSYRAGDDLKYLDWKLFARTDRLYTRQFRETTNVPVMIVLDSSASMDFPDGVSKHRYAAIISAALAYVASDQGNAVGLMTMADGALSYLPARGGRQHLRTIIAMLDRLEAAGTWNPAHVIDRTAQLMRRRGIVIVISDFYDDEDATRRALQRVTMHGHDVSVVQLLSPEESVFDEEGQVEFVDLESGARRLTDAGAIAGRYRDAMHDFVTRTRTDAVHAGIDYVRLSTDMPPERALRDYLQRRGARHIAGHAHRPMSR
ncbi:MAG: DUF58 domain-containing protein [Gemmatimonadetes bacterium]|nr:DUF58 domain-containing protein [Gemmatimonadota bacterium]